MKNTLMIPLVFIGNLILWIVLLSLFSVPASYTTLMALASGHFLFFLREVIASALYLFPISVMLALIYLFFFLMRHKTIFFVATPLVLLLVVLSVVFAIPFSYRVSAQYMAITARGDVDADGTGSRGQERAAIFSQGLIRTDSGGKRVIWLSADGTGRVVRGAIVADGATNPGTHALSVYPEARYDPLTRKLSANSTVLLYPAGGADPLISDKLTVPGFLVRLVRDVYVVLAAFRSSAVNGLFNYYMTVGGFFALVCCLWLVCHATGWRLLNALLSIALCRLVFLAYPFTTGGPVFDTIRLFLPTSIDSSLISPLVLQAIAALFLVLALAVFIARKIRHSGPEAFYD